MNAPEVVERTELLGPGPAQALAGLLGVRAPTGPLPPLWHWIYLLDRPAQDDLGPDGHRFRGGLPDPPGPGRRRMWAGGRVRVHRPLLLGRPATRSSRVLSRREKVGRSGQLTFTTVLHLIRQDGATAVEEEQDIVYRDAAAAPAPLPPRTTGAGTGAGAGEWELVTSPVLLFRFSALTYNGHRIHYDRDYAREVEGYPGLLVHGPLQALTMAWTAAEQVPVVRSGPPGRSGAALFEYRLVAPLFDGQGMIVASVAAEGGGVRTTVRDRGGRVTATGLFHPC